MQPHDAPHHPAPGTPAAAGASASPAPGPAAAPAFPAAQNRPITINPVKVLRQHSTLLGVTAFVALILAVGSWLVLRQFYPLYRSEAQLVVTGARGEALSDSAAGTLGPQNLDQISSYIRTQTLRLRGEDILNQVLQNNDVRATRWFLSYGGNTIKARKDLQEALGAGQIRGSTVISVSFEAAVPDDAKRILTTVVDTYLSRARGDASRESDRLRAVFNTELAQLDVQLRNVQEAIRTYTLERDIANLDSRASDASIEYTGLAQQSSRLQIELGIATDAYNSLLKAQQEGQGNYGPREMEEVRLDPAVRTQEDKLRALRERREALLGQFGENHLEVRRIDRALQVAEQEKRDLVDQLLRQRAEVRIQQAQGFKTSIEAQIASIQPKLELARNRMSDLQVTLERYRQMEVEASRIRQRRDQINTAMENLKIGDARPDNFAISPQFSVTDPQLSFPKPQIIIPGITVLLTGLVVGLVFLREVMDQRVKGPDDARAGLAIDLLGVVPDSAQDPSGAVAIDRVVAQAPSGLMAEVFRQLRTAVMARMERGRHKTLLVAGPQAQAGVSAVVSNLALSLATQGRRVLVVDANFRRPDQHQLLQAPAAPGLADLLSGARTLDQCLHHGRDDQPDLLPVGDPARAVPELLDRPAFAELLQQLSARYDVILLDVPPVLITSEAHMLTRCADAALLVVRAMQDRKGMVARAVRELRGHKAHLLGVVLNGARTEAGGYFRQNYEAFYRYRNGTPAPASTPASDRPTPIASR